MEVELWDCGGESENIWPAIAAKADGKHISTCLSFFSNLFLLFK